MNELPKVTIMISTYNQSKFVSQAIESALAQDYPNLEIVISDDCSTDDTPKLIENYLKESKIKFFRNEKNLGMTLNFRKLLYECASGEWVVHLDGDDYYTDSHFISSAIEQVKRYEKVVLVGAGCYTHSLEGNFRYIPVKKLKIMNGFECFLNWDKYRLPHFAVLYKRDLACKLDFYRFSVYGRDWESFLRLVLHGRVVLLNKAVGVYRKHLGSATSDINFQRHIEGLKVIEEPYRYALSLGYDPKISKKWRKKMIRRHWISYLNRNVYLANLGLIQKKELNQNFKKILHYVKKNNKDLLYDLPFLLTFLTYLIFGKKVYARLMELAKRFLGLNVIRIRENEKV